MEVSFSGILNHLPILEQQKKKLYMIREGLESSIQLSNEYNYNLSLAKENIERLIRNIDKKYALLEDLVMELKYKKQESEHLLIELDSIVKNHLLIEDLEN